MENDVVNFDEVINADNNRKRKTPVWSGQDVLEIGLTSELTDWVLGKINAVRVWPKGAKGFFKKVRVAMRMVVKHSLFGSLMTFMVLLNTIVMAMQRYNMPQT